MSAPGAISAAKKDISRLYRGSEGSRWSKFSTCVRSPGLQAVLLFRFGNWLSVKGVSVRVFLQPVYALLNHRVKSKWGIDIDRRAKIGGGLVINHYGGIFVGPQVSIGESCVIGHNVTLGLAGEGPRRGAPMIGDNVTIAPGAVIAGRIRIGDDSAIGPNVVVMRSIPERARVFSDPIRWAQFPPKKEPNG